MKRFLIAVCGVGLLGGCTFKRGTLEKVESAVARNDRGLQEESRALTTAVVDVLSVGPTNEHSQLALEFARQDQLIEGMPLERIDVAGILAGHADAVRSYETRIKLQDELLKERTALAAKLKNAEQELIAMGRLYEAEKNKGVLRRIWTWGLGTLGVGGMIALAVIFPAVIPLLGSLVSWLVGKMPGLASYFGVVGKKAFDAVVLGVGNVRKELKSSKADDTLKLVNTELQKATDEEHRRLIDYRRVEVGV